MYTFNIMDITIVALLFFVGLSPQQAESGSQPPQRTAELVGHVISVETHRSQHTTQNGGFGTSISRDTEIQVGNLVYECSQIHRHIQVGKDYPITIGADKHGVAKKLILTVGEKKYIYRISGTREVKN